MGLGLVNSVPTGATGVDTPFGGNSYGPPPVPQNFSVNGGVGSADFVNTDGRDMGLRANEVVTKHFVMCPDLTPAENAASAEAIKAIGVGMLLFARKHFAVESGFRRNGSFQQTASIMQSGDQTQFFEWTQLARWLANHSARYNTAQEVLEEWKFVGGLKNEVVANTTATYGRRPHTRLMNACVRGPFTAFNIWNDKLISGQSLYFIAKKGPADVCFVRPGQRPGARVPADQAPPIGMRGFDPFAYALGERAPKRPRLEDTIEKELVENYVWKVVPWTSRTKTRPSLADLVYKDVDSDGEVVTRVGACVKVGVVHFSEGFMATSGGQMRCAPADDAIASTIGLFNRGLLNNVEIFIGI